MKTAFLTADLYDAFEKECTSCAIQFQQYGGRRVFSGRVRTVRCFDDNALLKGVLGEPSDGGVLVVDGNGSFASALIGDLIAEIGRKSGWSGVIVYGAIRDIPAMVQLDFGLKALGANPRKSLKHGTGEVDVAVGFGGAVFTPGYWVYSDEDGILVSSKELILPPP